MPEERLIDANALIKDIVESIRFADEREKESYEKEDKHGLKCAIDTRRSLLAMISRVKDVPTIEAEPVRYGRWVVEDDCEHFIARCSKCGRTEDSRMITEMPYCHCGAKMCGGAGNG